MVQANPRLQKDVTPKLTSAARSARTRCTPRPLIWTRGSIARAQDRARSCASSAILMENRNGLVVEADLARATGHAEQFAVGCEFMH
jgi:hypothetical protein